MDVQDLHPRFKVGDFVRCVHVYYNYHYYYGWHNDEPEPMEVYYGLVVEVDYACWDTFNEDYEVLYIIQCTDGIRRFFSEDEIYEIP